jgi:hypothetical protein
MESSYTHKRLFFFLRNFKGLREFSLIYFGKVSVKLPGYRLLIDQIAPNQLLRETLVLLKEVTDVSLRQAAHFNEPFFNL